MDVDPGSPLLPKTAMLALLGSAWAVVAYGSLAALIHHDHQPLYFWVIRAVYLPLTATSMWRLYRTGSLAPPKKPS
jgi:hypothetical protein